MQQGQPPPASAGRSQAPAQAPAPAQQARGPGGFSPLPGAFSSASVNPSSRKPSTGSRPPPLRVGSSGSEEGGPEDPAVTLAKARRGADSAATPIYNQFATAHANPSSSSLQHQNFSRPVPAPAPAPAPALGGGASRMVPPAALSPPLLKNHLRKHSATQGMFDSTLPSTSTSNLSQASIHTTAGAAGAAAMAAVAAAAPSNPALVASQMAAQAAAMSHQNGSHARQRSQTVPMSSEGVDGVRRGSGSKMPMGPPTLSLTEASAPRDGGALGGIVGHPSYFDRPAATYSSAATAAANVVFPRSGHNSPREKSTSPQPQPFPPAAPAPPVPAQPPPVAAPPPVPEKSKAEKTKHKLFSRPGKSSSSKAEAKEKNLTSPGKIGSALSVLQRGNFSTSSLVESAAAPSIYTLNNSSSATIRPIHDAPLEERVKEKEKKHHHHHHFLSRQKQKLKDEYHLPLSSASSNSKPTDPNAPSSLYNFHIPQSPAHGSSTFAKVKKDKKLAERSDSRGVADNESSFNLTGDWSGAAGGPYGLSQQQSAVLDSADPGKVVSQHNLAVDEAWPFLKSKLLVIFEGEDVRLPVEDFNRIVQTHIQWCMHKRSPRSMLDDLRDLLANGFCILDRTLRSTPEDRVIPTLVELWIFTFTTILPYMQSVFLPLELEVSGCGVLMTPEQARDFWRGVVATSASSTNNNNSNKNNNNSARGPGPGSVPGAAPPAAAAGVDAAASILDVRRLVLTAYRDIVVLPRYETLKTIFSRLSLEFLPSSFASTALASPAMDHAHAVSTSPSESQFSMARPATAMSADPSASVLAVGSYNSTSTGFLGGDGSERSRSRAVSNVSFGSHGSAAADPAAPGVLRPYTPSSAGVPGGLSRVREREQNVEDSKQVTDMVGRMLQCMSVLSSIGGGSADVGSVLLEDEEGGKRIEELSKMLKLNWLGRGRTGRNRRGFVGGRVRREEAREELRVA
ncbi:hypothetical protein E4U54_004967 [Claviceps lovelessii]|nr:hypothetical protein E4U54_004967 [Claviceps lovelessii]